MSRDPIIDEVRAIRESIMQEHGNDLGSLFRMLQEAASESGRQARADRVAANRAVSCATCEPRCAPRDAVSRDAA